MRLPGERRGAPRSSPQGSQTQGSGRNTRLGQVDGRTPSQDPGRLPQLPHECSTWTSTFQQTAIDTGEPDACKRARPVRRGAVGKGLLRQDLAGGLPYNVDASNFGLLDRRLDWQALGITLPRGADLAFHPPRCGLVPDRYRLPLLRPAAQVHTALHRYSYHFRLVETLFETPAYRWVPWRAWPEFERAFAGACERLVEAQDAYEANFGTIRQTVLETFTQLATDSARRLEATGQPVSAEFSGVIARGVLTALPTPE